MARATKRNAPTHARAGAKPKATKATRKSVADFNVELWLVEDVKPYERNPRTIPQHAIDAVANAIRTFGFRQPIVVDRKGVIIVGHTRWRAASQLGLERVPVHVANLTAAKARQYRLADNRVGEETGWDREALVEELTALLDDEQDLDLTGFNDADLARLLGGDDDLDVAAEWEGMPEYTSEDKTAFQSVIVHLPDAKARAKFANLIGQTVTEKTRSLWYPPAEIDRIVDKVYEDEDAE